MEDPVPLPPLKVMTRWTKPGQGSGDWFFRHMGLKNKVKIYNNTEHTIKVRYLPKALLDGVTCKGNGAEFNNNYEWCEVTIYPYDIYKIYMDTFRSTVEIEGTKLLCFSSEDIVITHPPKRRPLQLFGGCCMPPETME